MARSLDTLTIHAGEPRDKAHDSLVTPLILSTAYPFRDTAELHRYFRGEIERNEEYGRYGNPTQAVAEARLAALDGGEAALLTASGMAAIVTTLLAIVKPGAHLVITADSYRKTRVFVRDFLAKFGVEHSCVEPDVAAIAAAITPRTRLIISETPTNPYLNCLDLEALAALARAHRIKTLIDATLATPFNLRPLEFGIDIVIHSATKYLGGHNDLLAGVVVGKREFIEALRDHQGMFGALPSPFAAYLLIRGLKTFAVRMQRHNESALRIARFLESHPGVERVWYPGLESHPSHAIARRQMRGFGGLISFTVRGNLEDATRVVDRVRIPFLAPSLGGAESLIEQPPLMSYYEKSPEERAALGIRENLIRLSVGLEDPEDLIADLAQALAP
ncbi:MAG: aminotransferase class I/II-fold pyridoxal phosphate-dependent enzyme [Planctomycetota bacterium]|nr:aminotransferase class I/II-fold pyridoxal phosphate-dependent enzyme [Planctomycetota bacterium]MDW8372956.1 aminotransferase class I/II-fold pyridoxal phosphate-dependent enzyme [Planctomycetota bacterium]